MQGSASGLGSLQLNHMVNDCQEICESSRRPTADDRKTLHELCKSIRVKHPGAYDLAQEAILASKDADDMFKHHMQHLEALQHGEHEPLTTVESFNEDYDPSRARRKFVDATVRNGPIENRKYMAATGGSACKDFEVREPVVEISEAQTSDMKYSGCNQQYSNRKVVTQSDGMKTSTSAIQGELNCRLQSGKVHTKSKVPPPVPKRSANSTLSARKAGPELLAAEKLNPVVALLPEYRTVVRNDT